jgi:hypothetical protein
LCKTIDKNLFFKTSINFFSLVILGGELLQLSHHGVGLDGVRHHLLVGVPEVLQEGAPDPVFVSGSYLLPLHPAGEPEGSTPGPEEKSRHPHGCYYPAT